MDREDEILRIVQEIKDNQKRYHDEWLERVNKVEEQQKQDVRNISKTKRSCWKKFSGTILRNKSGYLNGFWKKKTQYSCFLKSGI